MKICRKQRSACSRRPCAEDARAAGRLKLCRKVRRLAVNGEASRAAWATRAGATDAERTLAGGPGHGHYRTRHCVASDWAHQTTAVRPDGDAIGAKGERCLVGNHAVRRVGGICDPSDHGPRAFGHADDRGSVGCGIGHDECVACSGIACRGTAVTVDLVSSVRRRGDRATSKKEARKRE